MAANKKRRKLPEEDLAAAVADIINSPITRSNLSFLRPLAEIPPVGPAPMGVGANAIGFSPEPIRTDDGLADFIEPAKTYPDSPAVPEVVEALEARSEGVASSWQPTSPARPLWQAEGLGTLFEQTRVRRIYQAQDALSLVEEKVYDLLWGTKNQRKDDFRLVHYSLQRIASEARINIKTVRELIPRLIDKGFIQIEHDADVRRNIPTLYRVSSYAAVLSDQKRRNRLYVAKTGKGVFYVHPVTAELGTAKVPVFETQPVGVETEPRGVNTTGVDVKPMGVSSEPAGARPIGPMGLSGPKPMGAGGTLSLGIVLGKEFRQTTTTTALPLLVDAIKNALGVEPDTELLTGMISACHQNALQTTGEPANDDELIYFVTTKAGVVARSSNIRNHLAVLRKAVPECFLGDAFRAYRTAAALRKQKATERDQGTAADSVRRERELAEAEARHRLWTAISERHKGEPGYDMEAIAGDPDLDDLGRQQAKSMVERLGRYTRSGI